MSPLPCSANRRYNTTKPISADSGRGAFAFAEHITLFLSLAQNRGFCRRGVPATFFRERALLHYPARCADNRNVILSRRACGVSKNLPRPPQSSCNAVTPAYLYANSAVTPQDPSSSCLAIARHFAQDDRTGDASKNLLRLPQSDYNAIMTAFLPPPHVISTK